MGQQFEQAAALLRETDCVVILTHNDPDGDTLGAGFALYYGLKQMGKKAVVWNRDAFPAKFSYFIPEVQPDVAEKESLFVAVDVADGALLEAKWKDFTFDLCIDHHLKNRLAAKCSVVDAAASSTCEMMYELLLSLGVTVDQTIANCLYTGLCTDTGCFKFSNAGPKSHRLAAVLMESGAKAEQINRKMFETKSRARLALERMVLDGLAFYVENRVALVVVTDEMMQQAGADSSTFDGVSSIPRTIEGVQIGFTLRQTGTNRYKVSVRTGAQVNAADLCAVFDGGGHARAAGCTLEGELGEIQEKLLTQAKSRLE